MNRYSSFTAVVPSCNQGKYLEEALCSLINQNYPNLAIVVMDGGSTDNSVDIIRRYESKLAYWVSEKDEGQSDAINRGFAQSNGEWLLWLNSDDALFPGALAHANEIIQVNQPDIIAGSTCQCDKDSKIIQFLEARPFPLALAKRGVVPFSQPSTFFRRSKFTEVGGVRTDLRMIMDTELWTRMVRAGAKVTVTRRLLSFFRKHGEAKGADAAPFDEEDAALYASLGYNAWYRELLSYVFKIKCLFQGVYLRDMIMTKRFLGKTISEIWSSDNWMGISP